MLYYSICWMDYLNLLVKSGMVSSFCLRMVFKEMMFLFFRTEWKYCDMNAAHSSSNKLIV